MKIKHTENKLYDVYFDNGETGTGYTGESIFDIFSVVHEQEDCFDFADIELVTKHYKAEWNQDLEGYVITFNDGKCAYTQVYTESNRLHADHGETYIESYPEYDDNLSEDQKSLVDDFIENINRIKHHFG